MPKFDKQALFKLVGHLTKAGKLDHNAWWCVPIGKLTKVYGDAQGIDNAVYLFKHIQDGFELGERSVWIMRPDPIVSDIRLTFAFMIVVNEGFTSEDKVHYRKEWEDLVGRVKIACDRSERIVGLNSKPTHRYELIRVTNSAFVIPHGNSILGDFELRINLTESDFE